LSCARSEATSWRELVLLQRFLEHHLELLLLERLAEKIGGAEPHRLDDDAGAALARR
jgi:hypothetical protein